MNFLLKVLRPYKKHLILCAITDAIGVLLLLCMPYVMSMIVDEGIAKSDLAVIVESAILMSVLSILSICSSLIANRVNTKLSTGFTADLCKLTFEKINNLSYNQYSKIGPSGLLTRVTDDIFNIEGMASTLVYTVVTIPIMVIGSIVLAFLSDITLAIVFMLSVPPVMIIVYFFVKPLDKMWEKSDKYVDEQNKIVRERLSGLRVVRSFNNEPKEHSRAKFATEEMSKYMISANVRGGYIEPVAMLLLNIATVVMVAVGGIRAEAGLLDNAGDIVSIMQYVAMLSSGLISLSWTLSWLPRVKVSVNRINEVFSFKDEDVSVNVGTKRQLKDFDIVANGVSFYYPQSKVKTLDDINFTIKTGEKIAIIGGTGSGKTTLARLVLGLLDVSEGEFTIGGVKYSELGKSEIRKRFSISLQRPMIFEGTVRDNIKMGKPDASEEEICKALFDCKMLDFVKLQKDGLDHLLVGGGQNVSGGQKQRLNMARTVIKDAQIYIFDDSFSALDFLTESQIKSNLDKRLNGKTVITITQRVSTAMRAERIFLIDKGKIVGVGTHNQLLAESSIYREICISQLGAKSVGGEING